MTHLYKENVKINRKLAVILSIAFGLTVPLFSRSVGLWGASTLDESFWLKQIIVITICLLVVFNLSAWFKIFDSSIKRGYLFWRKDFALTPNMKVYIAELESQKYGWVKFNSQNTNKATRLLNHPMIFITHIFRLKKITGIVIEDESKLYSLPTEQPDKVKEILDQQIAKLQPNPQF